MTRPLPTTVAVLGLALSLLAATASGAPQKWRAQKLSGGGCTHGDGGGGGGGDGGPGDLVPPPADSPRGGAAGGYGGPGDVPAAAPSPATPGATPVAPGGRRAPATPIPVGAPRGATPSALTPMALIAASDRSEWWHWWEYHRELYLDLDAALARLGPATPASDGTVGERRRGLTLAVVYGRIVPSILSALEAEDDPRLVRHALLALGRVGEVPTALAPGRSVDVISARLGDGRLAVAEAAVIGLGALASPESAEILGDLLLDTGPGRELCGRRRVPVRMRALAAYGLGVCGGADVPPAVRRYAVHALAQLLRSDVNVYPDVQAAAVIALGLMPTAGTSRSPEGGSAPPSASLESQVRYLLATLLDDDQPQMVRTHAPTALARLLHGDPDLSAALRSEVVEVLLAATARHSRERLAVRRSAIVALGEIADADGDPLDREVRARLAECVSKGDIPSRHFAVMALARIGGRPGTGVGEPLGASEEVAELLMPQLARGKSGIRPWAGLGLGVLGYHLREQGELLGYDVANALLHSASSAKNPTDVAAYCLAVGLIGDSRARDAVAAQLERVHDLEMRSHVALGLGMVGDRSSVEALSAVMDESLHEPLSMEAAALGRALAGDPTLVDELVERLKLCDCQVSTLGVCRGLAWSGDHRALEPLLALLADGDLTAGTRANAVEALGRIADRSNVPWDVRISAGLNYLDAPTSLTDASGFGILDTF